MVSLMLLLFDPASPFELYIQRELNHIVETVAFRCFLPTQLSAGLPSAAYGCRKQCIINHKGVVKLTSTSKTPKSVGQGQIFVQGKTRVMSTS